MKRRIIRWTIGIVMTAITLTGVSCTKEKAGKKETAKTPPGHEKMVEGYKKGVEESKGVVVAKVNGAEITMRDLIERMNQIAPQYAKDPRDLTPELDQKVRKEAFDILIFRELAVQEAVRQGLKVPPGEIDEVLKNIKANAGSQDAYKGYLGRAGLNEESLRKQIGRNLLFDMVVDTEIFRKAKGEGNREQAIEKRKRQWEAELKKKAKIEIILGVVIKD